MASSIEGFSELPKGFTIDQPETVDVEESVAETQEGLTDLPEGFVIDPKPPKTAYESNQEVLDLGKKGINKVTRTAAQIGTGLIQRSAFGLDASLAAVKKGAELSAPQEFRQNILSDINDLLDKKGFGTFEPEDQKEYDRLVDLINNPEKMDKFIKPDILPDLDTGSLIEKGAELFGFDLRPKGAIEHAARWLGFIKNPSKAMNLTKSPVGAKAIIETFKALKPSVKELSRATLAGTAIQNAAEAEFGPFGTIMSAITGDLLPDILLNGKKFLLNPIQTIKKTIASLAAIPSKLAKNKEKTELTKQVIREFREAGLQPDIGSITNSKLVQGIQTALDQSQFTGDTLEVFKKNLLSDITNQYKEIADQIGNYQFANITEVGEAVKNAAKVEDQYFGVYQKPKGYKPRSLQGRVSTIEEPNLTHSQQNLLNNIASEPFVSDAAAGLELITVAQDIERPIRQNFSREWTRFENEARNIQSGPQPELANTLESILAEVEGSLSLGASPIEAKYIHEVRKLLNRITVGGDINQLTGTSVVNLLKTKRTLGNIPNWEIRGSRFAEGFKGLYRQVNQTIESALGNSNPQLLNRFRTLNSEFTTFKNTFENKSVAPLFKRKNIKTRETFKKALNPDVLESIDQILDQSAQGRRTANRLKRDYIQSQLGDRILDQREIENIRSVIGPQNERFLDEYIAQQNLIAERVGRNPRVSRPEGASRVPTPTFQAYIPRQTLQGRVSPSKIQKSKAFFNKLKGKTPEQISANLNTVSGIREIREILAVSPEGIELYNSIARFKLDEIFGNNLEKGVQNQLKLGTFSKVLNNPKNASLVKEIVGPEIFARIKKLENSTSKLAETAQTFFNASKSGSRGADYLISAALVQNLGSLFLGNPFPIMASGGSLFASRYLTRLITDKKFLTLVEDAILESKTGFTPKLDNIVKQISDKTKLAIEAENISNKKTKK